VKEINQVLCGTYQLLLFLIIDSELWYTYQPLQFLDHRPVEDFHQLS